MNFRNKVTEKFIFLNWGAEPPKSGYAYTIMLDAICESKLKYQEYPLWFTQDRWNKLHSFILSLPAFFGRFLWKMYIPFEMDSSKHYIMLFNEWMPTCQSSSFMRFLKRKYNVSTVLVIRNMLKNKERPVIGNSSLDELKDRFDLVVTSEKYDADLFDLFWLPNSFSAIECGNDKTEWDCIFIGKDQGRLPKLEAFAKQAEAQGIRSEIQIVRRGGGTSDIKSIHFSKRIPYRECIENDLKSNCILEILQEGQKSYSLRFQEAVCLNKKLLTNNAYVKQEKYYNPEFVQVFDDVKDIDWDFVRDVIPVDYQYDGEFSSIRFLEDIENELHRLYN